MSQTAPLLDKQGRAVNIAQAAWTLEDALNDRLVDRYPNDLAARDLHIRVAQADRDYSKAMLAMLVLTALETPSWCDTTNSFWSYVAPEQRCTIPGVSQKDVYLSDLPYIPPGWGVLLELVLLFVIARKLLLERQLQIRYFDKLAIQYSSLRVIRFGLAMCLLEVADCIFFIVFRPRFRLAFLSRTGYLCQLPAVQRLALCISAVLGEFLSIAVFYGGTIVFFAWIAVVIYNDMEGTVYGEPVNKGFESFRTTLNTMFVAGSTDEFVGCFVLTYTAHRASGLLWLLFLIIVQVLLLNLVLDTLVAAYTRYQEFLEEQNSAEAVEGIKKAFKGLLAAAREDSTLSKETFLEFSKEFSRSPNVRPIPAHNADIVFKAVDKDNSGQIEEMEFFNICSVVQYDFWTTLEDSPVKERLPALWACGAFQWFRARVVGGGFDTFMNWVLMVNLVLVITECVYDLNEWGESPFMENLELSFSMVYVLEVALKLSVWDFSYYWAWRSNVFDFFTTWLLLMSSILDELASTNSGSNLKRYMNILRLMRLLRVLKQIKSIKKVQLMVETMCNIVSASRHIMTLLGVVIFFFSSLSVQLWGGILHPGNAALEESEYKEQGMWVLNFNDFGCAFGVWVVSVLRAYLPLFPDAVARASPIEGSWLIFVFFYIAGASVVFQLVKAFTIEAFLEIHKKWDEPQEELGALRTIENEFAKSGLCLHYRVAGDLGTHEKIMKALEEECKELEDEDSEAPGH